MALVRILVDGYSLLHNWPQLAPGKPRHSAGARDELIRRLTLYRDAIGTPITIVFDGSGPRGGKTARTPTPELEVLYSRAGKTADDIIERVAVRLQPFGEVLAVTDDYVERDTVSYHAAWLSVVSILLKTSKASSKNRGATLRATTAPNASALKPRAKERQPCR